jgi:hypothetical protein
MDTRRTVLRGWIGLRDTLRADGRDGLARDVEVYLKVMPPPQTERESIAQTLIHHARTHTARDQEARIR